MEKHHLRNCHRMKRKAIKQLNQKLENTLGVKIASETLDSGEFEGKQIYIEDHEIIAIDIGDSVFLTLKGILKIQPERCYVVVDDGAVKFLYNGADVMAPGIMDADPNIAQGNTVWVKEEKHGQPLVIGTALISGPEMIESQKGKAIKTLYHLNDDLWNAEV